MVGGYNGPIITAPSYHYANLQSLADISLHANKISSLIESSENTGGAQHCGVIGGFGLNLHGVGARS